MIEINVRTNNMKTNTNYCSGVAFFNMQTKTEL